jgi:DNA-binding transcriptional regulator WhiA
MVTKKSTTLGHTVQFRVSKEELERWHSVIKSDGFDTLSEWLRHMARLRVKRVEGRIDT